MGEVLPLPHRGDVFLDPRGEGRSLRVSGHRGAATVVLSIWRQGECRATFRLAGSEVDDFIRALLSAAPPAAPGADLPAVAGEAVAPPAVQVQISGNVVVELNHNVADATPVATAETPDLLDEPETTGDLLAGLARQATVPDVTTAPGAAAPGAAAPEPAPEPASPDPAQPGVPEGPSSDAGDDSSDRRPGVAPAD
ncbi:hypothetical protein [Cryptosporangium aurantiacum]|uniref:Uncharacterized protein n=1 Tax=Cryptosporangium aurantiacum TaxID=134849 RepID=A0A1M7NNA4_9ACTN|nr:hypothetical protein [Cryptosporangium aurantiacum]SHN05445.1 hypothetical protein SAMN05443668_102743 [Cryptosporangium aurantiacum]